MTQDSFEIGFDLLFSELYKIVVNKVTFVGFREERSPQSPPMDPPLSLVKLPYFNRFAIRRSKGKTKKGVYRHARNPGKVQLGNVDDLF